MKKKLFFLTGLLCLCGMNLFAQNSKDRAYIIQQTNVKVLKHLSQKFNKDYHSGFLKAQKKKVKQQIIDRKGQKGYFSGYDIKGRPFYDFDDNIDVAKTNRVDKIWQGGSSKLNLTGKGIVIGHWEAGGLALSTHQELTGRVTHLEFADGSSHSTHTACTMIGKGVEFKAHGMASEATILSRRSDNDLAELAEFAAGGGILSNHSYSRGNPDGDNPLYGIYTTSSHDWDEILYNAPYLSVCKSAGNNRNDGVNTLDNGYDILYTIAVAKNLLTIGAVEDISIFGGAQSIIQSEFGNWGPTDDWRIKPDIVAGGVAVYSATDENNVDYGTKSGTSMSTASVTGTIALLQQHFHNLNDVYMKSATVKALLVATADEAGIYDGPDFQNGWGLLNAQKAADVISNKGTKSIMRELIINNGEKYTLSFNSDGSSPLSLAIAWTDVPGTPLMENTHDNLTPMLVNDLDVRIIGNDIIYEPWVLEPNDYSINYKDAALKGDNYRDNVERIDVENLPQGNYQVVVTHKGSLENNKQEFSLVINGISEVLSSPTHFNDINKELYIYPNPSANGHFFITIPEKYFRDKCNMKVYDIQGKLRYTGHFYKSKVDLNLSNLKSGLFFLRIQMDNFVFKKSILIEK